MKKKELDQIFFESEGDKFFLRNGPRVNRSIFKAVKFIKPNAKTEILEIGCGCGSTLKKIKTTFKSKVWGIDTSKRAIEYSKKKNKLKNTFYDKFLTFKKKSNFNIVIAGGFLYTTSNKKIEKSINKLIKLTKKNSYLIIWDYDTPFNYTNPYKHEKNVKSHKRNLLNLFHQFKHKLYLVSKYLSLKDGTKIKHFNNNTITDNIFAVMIFKKIR